MEWKQIEGFENIYEISSTGLVKSCERIIINPVYGLQKRKERILKPDCMKDGYLRITLLKDKKIYKYPIHVLVAKAFIKNTSNYSMVNHKDENKSNNNFDNLEWCNSQYNLEYSLSRYYLVTDPIGNSYNVFNLSQFCNINNLNISAMSGMATQRIPKGKTKPIAHHKGWICKYLTGKPIRGVLQHEC